jgi:diphthamide biosynthesis protein 2
MKHVGAVPSAGAKTEQLVEVRNAADYFLMRRSFKGLEVVSPEDPPKPVEKAVLGRVGRAAAYSDEPRAASSGQT